MVKEPTNQELFNLLKEMSADIAKLYRDMIRIETRLCKLACALGQEHVLGK